MRDPYSTSPNDRDEDDDFPVLTEVVREGDSELIQAAREAYSEIQQSVTSEPKPAPPMTPAEISRSITSPQGAIPESGPFATRGGTRLPLTEAQLEQLIDEIIERHAEQMRNELHTILKHR